MGVKLEFCELFSLTLVSALLFCLENFRGGTLGKYSSSVSLEFWAQQQEQQDEKMTEEEAVDLEESWYTEFGYFVEVTLKDVTNTPLSLWWRSVGND
jgi:hypothetical protein